MQTSGYITSPDAMETAEPVSPLPAANIGVNRCMDSRDCSQRQGQATSGNEESQLSVTSVENKPLTTASTLHNSKSLNPPLLVANLSELLSMFVYYRCFKPHVNIVNNKIQITSHEKPTA